MPYVFSLVKETYYALTAERDNLAALLIKHDAWPVTITLTSYFQLCLTDPDLSCPHDDDKDNQTALCI